MVEYQAYLRIHTITYKPNCSQPDETHKGTIMRNVKVGDIVTLVLTHPYSSRLNTARVNNLQGEKVYLKTLPSSTKYKVANTQRILFETCVLLAPTSGSLICHECSWVEPRYIRPAQLVSKRRTPNATNP